MQDLEVVQPGRIQGFQVVASATARVHRALAILVDQHDDHSCVVVQLEPDIYATSFQFLPQARAGTVVTDAADESGRIARCGECGHVRCRAAATHPHLGLDVRGLTGLLELPHDDVLDDITDDAEHLRTARLPTRRQSGPRGGCCCCIGRRSRPDCVRPWRPG